MSEKERVINDLNVAKLILCNPQTLTPEMCVRIGQAVTSAIDLLKEQEESIPVSWLEEKLDGHPELPYTTTDGINYVLDLWEGR